MANPIFFQAVLVLGMGMLCAAPCGAEPESSDFSLFPDPIVAKGEGIEIRQSELDELVMAFKINRAARGERVLPQMRPRIEAELLERLITTRLWSRLATDDDRARAREMAEKFIQEQKSAARTESAFQRQLLAAQLTEAEFEAQVFEQALVNAVIDRLVTSKLTVEEGELREFYQTNRDRFLEPEKVRVRHILFSTRSPAGQSLPPAEQARKRRLAESVRERALAGEDFVTLVEQFTEDPMGKVKGGETVLTERPGAVQELLVPEFVAAAFSLKPDQVSDIVTTRFGHHVIKLLERKPPRQLEFEEVEDQVREAVLQQKVEKVLPERTAELKKAAGLQVFHSGDRDR